MALLLAVHTARATVVVIAIQLAARSVGMDPEGAGTAAMMVAAMVPIALAARRPIEDVAGRIDARLEAEDAIRLKVATDGIEVFELVEEVPASDRLAVATDGIEAHDATEAELVAEYQAAVDRGDLVSAACLEAVIDLAEYRKRKDAAREVQDAAG